MIVFVNGPFDQNSTAAFTRVDRVSQLHHQSKTKRKNHSMTADPVQCPGIGGSTERIRISVLEQKGGVVGKGTSRYRLRR